MNLQCDVSIGPCVMVSPSIDSQSLARPVILSDTPWWWRWCLLVPGLGLKALTKIRDHENSKQGMRGISDLRLSYSSLTHKT